jgi:hypothetical protein
MRFKKVYIKMSSRDKTRVSTATRMLVNFEIDKSTYVHVRALIEGVEVMIDYEGQEYQADMPATIIKRNGKSFSIYY